MIYNNPGTGIVYGGKKYTVGESIHGTGSSIYSGLSGVIDEIRDGQDKRTEDAYPEVCCSFEPPVHPFDIQKLKQAYLAAKGVISNTEDMPFVSVPQKPFMVEPRIPTGMNRTHISLYMLVEDWSVECETGHNYWPFTDYEEARRAFNKKLAEEMKTGCIPQWVDDESYRMEHDQNSYESWLDGEYEENHYRISITEEMLMLTPNIVQNIWQVYQNRGRFDDFMSEMEQWDELADFTEEEYQQFISDTRIPGLIDNKLGETYWEAYWCAVSKAGRDLLGEYQKKKLQQKKPEEV